MVLIIIIDHYDNQHFATMTICSAEQKAMIQFSSVYVWGFLHFILCNFFRSCVNAVNAFILTVSKSWWWGMYKTTAQKLYLKPLSTTLNAIKWAFF